MSDSPSSPTPFRVEVSADKRTASLVVEPAMLKSAWDLGQLKKVCADAHLAPTGQLEQRLAELKDVGGRPAGTTRFEIAQAVDPVNGEPAFLLFTHPSTLVTKGELLGQVEAARSGRDGVDVLGTPIPHLACVDQMPVIPDGIRIEAGKIFADCDGYFWSNGQTAAVDEVLSIEPLQAAERPLTFERTVNVRGNVLKGVVIEAKRSFLVEGSVDSTLVNVGCDMVVQGIFGKGLGRYTVGHNLTATFIRQANVVVAGDVLISGDISDSDTTCAGRIIGPEAEIRGGRVHAEQGIEVNIIGSDALSKTLIEVGIDGAFDRLLEAKRNAIVAGKKHVEQVRMHIGPLMANPKRLTNQQKEKATELLFQADELQTRIEADIAELHRATVLMTQRAESALTVNGTIYPGTTIRFQGVETTVRSTIHGPVRIVATNFQDRPRILAFLGTSSTPEPLESRSTQRNVFSELRRLAA